MQLPNLLDDPQLNDLRARMGATELGAFRLSVNPYRFTMAELEELIFDGIDIRHLDEVRPLSDNTLYYKDRRVVLFQRDALVLPSVAAPAARLPHFHVSNCQTVRSMREGGSMARHAVTAREDGHFFVNLVPGAKAQRSLERLYICEACLGELAFDDYSPAWPATARVRALEGFTVTRFFEKYRRALIEDPQFAAATPAPDSPRR